MPAPKAPIIPSASARAAPRPSQSALNVKNDAPAPSVPDASTAYHTSVGPVAVRSASAGGGVARANSSRTGARPSVTQHHSESAPRPAPQPRTLRALRRPAVAPATSVAAQAPPTAM